ncbi:hypothetical protein Zmor_003641 [Zophobas morio]|uniref:Uncharacterized protein n=1 Tax=Zophobas morio TaxID=2755281 RepID=A0AA38HMA4_9CUCU|nr:hypothetical protein Zmor_003641 [Zophobas morio]
MAHLLFLTTVHSTNNNAFTPISSTKHRTQRRIWVSPTPSGVLVAKCCVYTLVWCHKIPHFHNFYGILLHAKLCGWEPRRLLAIPGLVVLTSHMCEQ